MVVGYLPVGFGLYPAWAADLIGIVAMGAIVFLLGSKVEDEGDGGIPTRLLSFLPARWRPTRARSETPMHSALQVMSEK